MSGVFCWLCNGLDSRADRVEKVVVDDCSEIDPGGSDMELDGKDLSVSIVDGPRQYIAHFGANYCPCCGKDLVRL